MKKISSRSLATLLAVLFCFSPLTASGFEMPCATEETALIAKVSESDFKAVELLFDVFEAEDSPEDDGVTQVTAPVAVAEVYSKDAADNHIAVQEKVYLENAPLSGDVNEDGKVDEEDFTLLQQYINGWNVTICLENADFNADGKVNNKDLGLIQKYILENGSEDEPDKPEDGGEKPDPKPGGVPELPEDPFYN